MLGLFVILWGVGFLGAAALNSVVRSDNPQVLRRGRVAFALLLGIELIWMARSYDVTNTGTISWNDTSRGFWWLTLICGIPIPFALGFTVRSAYAGHRVALLSAVLAAATLSLAFPLGFTPPHETLTGLGRFQHDHRALDIVALLIPTLILLASEVLRGHIDGPDVEEANILVRFRRTVGVGGAIAIAFVLWLLGASPATVLLGIGVAIVGLGLFTWWVDRAAVRRMRRNIK